jgi:hypothetical protein
MFPIHAILMMLCYTKWTQMLQAREGTCRGDVARWKHGPRPSKAGAFSFPSHNQDVLNGDTKHEVRRNTLAPS